MLEPVGNLPENIRGLRAIGTVIESDVTEAVACAGKSKSGLSDKCGLVIFVAADFDGYLAELIRGLEAGAARDCPPFTRWALVVRDDVMDEVSQYGSFAVDNNFRAFPDSERRNALAWVAG